MPKQYEAIRDKLIAEGKSSQDAKKHAAMIYNSKHPGAPVTRTSDKKKSKSKSKPPFQQQHMKDVLNSAKG